MVNVPRNVPLVEEIMQHYQDLVVLMDKDMDPSKRMLKESKHTLKVKVTKWAFLQAQIIGQIKHLQSENEKLKQEIAKGGSAPAMSYATVAGRNVGTSGNRVAQLVAKTKRPCTLFVTGKGNETAKEVQATFTK